MKKCAKKIAAMGAAAIMMISSSLMTASADNWSVRYTPNAPSSEQKTLWVTTFSSTGPISSLKESCTSYTSDQSNKGDVGFVKYWGYSTNSSGQSIGLRFTDYFHYRTQPTHTVEFNGSNPAYTVLTVKYQLMASNLRCAISGTVNK